MNGVARGVDQPGAFAAQRLGEQEPRRARHAQRRRMELDELEVGDPRAGAIGQRDAVAGGHRGIGRLAEDLSGAARGQQHAPARAVARRRRPS